MGDMDWSLLRFVPSETNLFMLHLLLLDIRTTTYAAAFQRQTSGAATMRRCD
jgi:hypothetical protein